jgi:hypothetical protein
MGFGFSGGLGLSAFSGNFLEGVQTRYSNVSTRANTTWQGLCSGSLVVYEELKVFTSHEVPGFVRGIGQQVQHVDSLINLCYPSNPQTKEVPGELDSEASHEAASFAVIENLDHKEYPTKSHIYATLTTLGPRLLLVNGVWLAADAALGFWGSLPIKTVLFYLLIQYKLAWGAETAVISNLHAARIHGLVEARKKVDPNLKIGWGETLCAGECHPSQNAFRKENLLGELIALVAYFIQLILLSGFDAIPYLPYLLWPAWMILNGQQALEYGLGIQMCETHRSIWMQNKGNIGYAASFGFIPLVFAKMLTTMMSVICGLVYEFDIDLLGISPLLLDTFLILMVGFGFVINLDLSSNMSSGNLERSEPFTGIRRNTSNAIKGASDYVMGGVKGVAEVVREKNEGKPIRIVQWLLGLFPSLQQVARYAPVPREFTDQKLLAENIVLGYIACEYLDIIIGQIAAVQGTRDSSLGQFLIGFPRIGRAALVFFHDINGGLASIVLKSLGSKGEIQALEVLRLKLVELKAEINNARNKRMQQPITQKVLVELQEAMREDEVEAVRPESESKDVTSARVEALVQKPGEIQPANVAAPVTKADVETIIYARSTVGFAKGDGSDGSEVKVLHDGSDGGFVVISDGAVEDAAGELRHRSITGLG